VPIFVSIAAIAGYNWMCFGTILETGYADQAHAFDTPLYVGLYGLLFSSGKSLFLYAPILLASVVGWFRLRRQRPATAWPIAALVIVYVVFYARYDWWYGGGPWRPRFIAVILPFLCIPLAAIVDRPSRVAQRSASSTLPAAALATLPPALSSRLLAGPGPRESRAAPHLPARPRLHLLPHRLASPAQAALLLLAATGALIAWFKFSPRASEAMRSRRPH